MNECHSNPCRNGATCIDGINRYTCKCVPGFTGAHCEINIDECASNPCANNGVCMDLVNGFKCECPRGYYDARCLSDVDECASNPCINGGRCEDGVNQFICHCPPGYGGKRCERDVDECDSNPCQHGGLCIDGLNSYTCNCMPGYTGVNCETNIDDCANNPCRNGGSCIDLVNGYKCACRVPFTGRSCENKMDPCQPNRCHNGAKCTPSSNFLDFSCSCSLGYTGRYCDQDINECALSSPCRNGATCKNTPGSYQCICAKGYEGRDCTINTDDCASFPCQNGGTCLDGIGDYTCLCLDGFEGKHCEVDIDECLSMPCQNGATCNQYVNSYTCRCPLGFSGINCETNDEDCTESSCMNKGTCIDGINSYNCSCQPGFTGSNCQYKINKCDSQPCHNGATCHDLGNDYSCHCAYGYTGKECTEYVDWCSQGPCENSATCVQRENTYKCICESGWTGKLCDVEMVSCKDAASRKGVSVKNLCNNGSCENIGNSHRCTCHHGYTGSYCQKEIDECESAPCQNGGTCKDLIGSYQCICRKGFQGQNCELNIDDCKPNPCRNGGTCHDLVNGCSCSCPPGTLGVYCEINTDDCKPGACHNNGTCIDKVGGYECRCPPGFVGTQCEGDINECLSNPCSTPGTLDCIQFINSYHCSCKPGYMGHHCEIKVDFCATSPCQNGAFCTSRSDGHHCVCAVGFYGKNCEFSGHNCDANPCNGGKCIPLENGAYQCECPYGSEGFNCEIDKIDECDPNPCKRGAACENKLNDFECLCPAFWSGKTCDKFDPTFKGYNSWDKNRLLDYEQDLQYQRSQCEKKNCAEKRNNRKCDEECNNYACDFDGGDCSLGLNPWLNCSASIDCWEVFGNGYCNEECNNAQCLFDGRDCEKKLLPCNPSFDAFCQKRYADGHCDYLCNTAECNWDGLDCDEESNSPQLAEGVISVIVKMEMEEFRRQIVPFLRDLGHQLRTTVRIKKDQLGNDMIYPSLVRSEVPDLMDPTFAKKHNIAFTERIGQTGVQVYLEIDNRRCQSVSGAECFDTAQEAAQFLGAIASKRIYDGSFPIVQVRGMNTPGEDIVDNPSNGKYVVTGAFIVLIACFSMGILVQKRKRGLIWLPEGYTTTVRTGTRRGPDGQEMRNLNKSNAQLGHSQQWSDDESAAKRSRMCDMGYSSDHTVVTDYEEATPRQWTQQHLEAASMRLPSSIMTPPSHNDKNEIDARGPGGITPLMVAISHGIGIDAGDDIDTKDDSNIQMINDLLSQGADLNARMERTGETALHLAARVARADAAKRILDNGADANCQDNTGRTPLHAAVAADARGVFAILLRHRATNLNARMHDGTTPLILAARLAIEGMVEDLIQADADINASDNSLKTALHWAAAVNNVDAVNILLCTANRDAQDEKEETPLFLAAREGSFEACKALLDSNAGRDIPDHMDRTPRDVAVERQHHDIVRLLDEHVPRMPQIMPSVQTTITSPMCQSQLIHQPTIITAGKQTKAKKKAKNATENADGTLKRKPSSKKATATATTTAPKKSPAQQTMLDIQLSSDGTIDSPATSMPSPYDTASLYSNAVATHHGLDMMSSAQPPNYEDSINKVNQIKLFSLHLETEIWFLFCRMPHRCNRCKISISTIMATQ